MVPPWILPAVIPLLEWFWLFLMSYGPRNEFDWLIFIFLLTSYTKGVLGFWGNDANGYGIAIVYEELATIQLDLANWHL